MAPQYGPGQRRKTMTSVGSNPVKSVGRKENMKRKFLEDLGLEKEVIDKIMDEHGAGVTAAKADVQSIEAERDDLKSKYEAAEQTISSLKEAESKNETLQQAIQAHEATIAQLQSDSDNMKKGYSIKEKLTALGVKDPDYIVFKHGGIDKFTFDQNGNPIGLEESITPYRESLPHLFNTGEVITNYEPNGGDAPPAVNPFAKETFDLTAAGKLLKENPAQAKQMADAANFKI